MALEQHPIPQNISSYEFRLVGGMTLKQFFQLAGGIVLALIIFRLPLPNLLKYPMVGLSVLVGVLMAFVPINGRPFTQWLTAFIRAIYSPTEFTWAPPTETPVTSPPLPTTSLSSSNSSFNSPSPTVQLPDKNRVAALPPLPEINLPKKDEPVKPTQTVYSKIDAPKPLTPPALSPTSTPKPPPSNSSLNSPLSTAQSPAPPPPISIYQPPSPKSTFNLPSSIVQTNPLPPTPTAPVTNLVTPPSLPNILVGMVTDSQGKALETVIIEIIDNKTGIPARALRTNRTGLFQIATPLAPGEYQIRAEKDGFTFDPTTITAKNSIIPPIILTAHA